jgi:hypothetical protein
MLKHAQSALEYLMIIAITLGIIVPTTYLFFRYSAQSTSEIVDSQVNQIGRSIMDTAESVYYSGESSKIVLEANIPKEVEADIPNGVYGVSILSNRELVFDITSSIGQGQSVFFSSPSITLTSIPAVSGGCPNIGGIVTCDLSSIADGGLKKIRITSIDDGSGGTEILIEKI